jgi:TetR/AcrR family transcriptional regulator, cholesterol catabolism regulator
MADAAPRKPNKKKLIVARSAELFRTGGYSATSMRDIADAVGVEAASLYNHIRAKTDLLREIIFGVADHCNQHLEELQQSQKTPGEKIEELIRFHVRLMINRYDEYSVMTHDWNHLPEQLLHEFAGQRRHYVQQMEQIVAQGIETGEFKNIIPYVAVLNILSAVMGLEFWQRSLKKYSDAEMEENIVQHLTNGLKKI